MDSSKTGSLLIELPAAKSMEAQANNMNKARNIKGNVENTLNDFKVQTLYSGKKLAPGTVVNTEAPTETSKTSNGTEPAPHNIEAKNDQDIFTP